MNYLLSSAFQCPSRSLSHYGITPALNICCWLRTTLTVRAGEYNIGSHFTPTQHPSYLLKDESRTNQYFSIVIITTRLTFLTYWFIKIVPKISLSAPNKVMPSADVLQLLKESSHNLQLCIKIEHLTYGFRVFHHLIWATNH